jgi:hypothetical protein
MQDIEERSDRVARSLPNLGLLNKGVIEECDGVLLLFVRIAPGLVTFGFFPCRRAGDVEPYLSELIPPSRSLPALPRCRAILAARLATVAERKLNCDFVAPGQVGVGDFGVGNFEGGSVLHVKRELGLAKLGLAPVPAPQRVFLVLEVGAVPALEDFAEPLVVLPKISPALSHALVLSIPLVESHPAG